MHCALPIDMSIILLWPLSIRRTKLEGILEILVLSGGPAMTTADNPCRSNKSTCWPLYSSWHCQGFAFVTMLSHLVSILRVLMLSRFHSAGGVMVRWWVTVTVSHLQFLAAMKVTNIQHNSTECHLHWWEHRREETRHSDIRRWWDKLWAAQLWVIVLARSMDLIYRRQKKPLGAYRTWWV